VTGRILALLLRYWQLLFSRYLIVLIISLLLMILYIALRRDYV